MQCFIVLRRFSAPPPARSTAGSAGSVTGTDRQTSPSRLFANGVVNVKNFYRVTRYPIEDFVWISDQRCDTNSRPLGNFLCALRPSGDARDDCVKPILERIGECSRRYHQGRQSPRWYRPLSCRAEFLENLLDLIIGSEAALARCLQAPIDSLKFFRCCVIRARGQACFNLQCDLCKLDLSGLRPSLDMAQSVLKDLGCHAGKYSMLFVQLKRVSR